MGHTIEVGQPTEFPAIIWNGSRFESWSSSENKFIPAVVNKKSWVDSYFKAQKALKKESGLKGAMWFKHFSLENGILKLGFRTGTGISKRSWIYKNLTSVMLARYIKQSAKSFVEESSGVKARKANNGRQIRIESTDFNNWNEAAKCFRTCRWPSGSEDDKLMQQKHFYAPFYGSIDGARAAALAWQRAKGFWVRPYKPRGMQD